MTEQRITWAFPLAGGCTVCGVEALGVVVYPDRRLVRHVPSARRRDCELPNPPAKTESGQR